jgi:hypothetical protein
MNGMEEKSKKELPKKEFYEKLDEESRDYEAVKEIIDMGQKKSVTEHLHRFNLQSGNKAECDCGWGFFLDNKDEIRDGKLYRDGTLII